MPAIPLRPRPDLNPRRPRFTPPPGATDTHFHIFGPKNRYPMVKERRFTPPDVSVEEYSHMLRTLGLSRAVLVQPSTYGTDNRRQLDAARAMDFPTRIIVVVAADVTDRELENLYKAGARGVRFNPSQPGSLPLVELERYGERLDALGWHIQLMLAPTQLIELAPRLMKLRCDFVLDHMSDIQAAAEIAQPAFQALLQLLDSGRCWVKLSAGYHGSQQLPPYRDMFPLVHALVKARPDRMLWGSDWPHVNVHEPMPNSADFLDLMLDWVPDETTRNRIFVDNPARLYGF